MAGQIIVNPPSGGGTFSGSVSTNQIAYGSAANTLASSAYLLANSAGHTAQGNASGLNGGTLWGGTSYIVSDNEETVTVDDSADGYYAGLFQGINIDFPGNSTATVYGTYTFASTASGSSHDLSWLQANEGFATHKGSGAVTNVTAYAAHAFNEGAGTVDTATLFWGFGQGGATGITTLYGVFFDSLGGTATSAYSFWSDETGVYRIKSDNTYNAVYQAIPALYNPQFTKYTPGAANYERCIPGCQWESNVAVITNEAGGTGTMRQLSLGKAGVPTMVIGTEQSDPAAPSANNGIIYFKDNGAGKTQACARFNTGAVQCFATEP